ncbi:ATP-binding cassette domain-containing protein [Oleomonas cavernae]|uniref:Quaternary amine transport ATP-binding protein n=1 Tax=Oleomonas cavernae TaxID=2320859 RepID=A0A418WBM5_9PROT|nr:betaine/proline/choline family ABC transporter ATP-binding protein [Oleomonas cavernae]RJF87412.1 ATP-binding cassette domain-containing protein [Oleomonas cavernae]
MPRVKIRGLTKIFGTKIDPALRLVDDGASRADILAATGCVVGLRNVSFDVAEGEILVVMGLSGSGKSTALRCINRLIEPTSGGVTVGTQEVMALDPKALLAFRRKTFGMVFQQFALFPHRSILRNAEYGLEIQGVAPEIRKAKALAALEQVGLKGWEDRYPSQLSGGMQQRAGLARALAVDTDILLMDEAFSALDPLIRRDMQQELVTLQKKLKKTIIFVSHDLDEAVALGGRIVLMRDGEIVQDGTAIDLLTSPADDYVRRFTSHLDVLGVITAGAIMRPLNGVAAAPATRVAAAMTLHEVLGALDTAGGEIGVQDGGHLVGLIGAHDLITALAARGQA